MTLTAFYRTEKRHLLKFRSRNELLFISPQKARRDQAINGIIGGAFGFTAEYSAHPVVSGQIAVPAIVDPELLKLGFVSHKGIG